MAVHIGFRLRSLSRVQTAAGGAQQSVLDTLDLVLASAAMMRWSSGNWALDQAAGDLGRREGEVLVRLRDMQQASSKAVAHAQGRERSIVDTDDMRPLPLYV